MESRLTKPRRVSTPEHGFIGTIQRRPNGWCAHDQYGALLTECAATAKQAVQSLKARLTNAQR